MQSQNRFFDDLSKILNGVAGTVAGVGREAEASARERAKEWFGGMDFVSRDEFEAVKEMAANARAEADALKKRVEALEKASGAESKRPAAKAAPARKSATPKPAARKSPPSKKDS
ncbi:accessory factor UbiK family protein [Parasphingorhabdus sp.]|uniref:accessory factor UbiK family protein n=1 Tax=Parasphingorhabdus sp. TaxID=2709688 RepID=UPI003A905E1B